MDKYIVGKLYQIPDKKSFMEYIGSIPVGYKAVVDEMCVILLTKHLDENKDISVAELLYRLIHPEKKYLLTHKTPLENPFFTVMIGTKNEIISFMVAKTLSVYEDREEIHLITKEQLYAYYTSAFGVTIAKDTNVVTDSDTWKFHRIIDYDTYTEGHDTDYYIVQDIDDIKKVSDISKSIHI